MEVRFKTIQQIYQRLKLLLASPENTNNTLSFESIVIDLRDICSRLSARKYHNAVDDMNTFEIILKYCLELLDTPQFIDLICQHHSRENFHLVIQILVHSLVPSDMLYTITSKDRQQMYDRLLNQLIHQQK
jgi:hypothetical protein